MPKKRKDATNLKYLNKMKSYNRYSRSPKETERDDSHRTNKNMSPAPSLYDSNHIHASMTSDILSRLDTAISFIDSSRCWRVAPEAEITLVSAAARVRDRLMLSDEMNGSHILMQCDRSS